MSKSRKSLKIPRTQAFINQCGFCFYCKQPMWNKSPEELTVQYPITLGQSKKLQCTGEHLVAHSEGGKASRNNIVAACHFCNQQRHKKKNPPTPQKYISDVRKRLNQGGWHGLQLR